jgi:GTP cyclohydrolase I
MHNQESRMKDIQNQTDHRRINIKKVGVKTISYPVTVLDKAKTRQNTIATVNMYVNLPHRFKGTHMSRFVEILNQFHGEIGMKSFHQIMARMKERLDAEASHLEMTFLYFLAKEQKPDSLNLCHYRCSFIGSFEQDPDLQLKVEIPVILPLVRRKTSGLPRSMGQWGRAEVTVRLNSFIWIEDLILHIERAIGDEPRQAAGKGQEMPSVETLTRRVADCLSQLAGVGWFSLRVENLGNEYSTFATLESTV